MYGIMGGFNGQDHRTIGPEPLPSLGNVTTLFTKIRAGAAEPKPRAAGGLGHTLGMSWMYMYIYIITV